MSVVEQALVAQAAARDTVLVCRTCFHHDRRGVELVAAVRSVRRPCRRWKTPLHIRLLTSGSPTWTAGYIMHLHSQRAKSTDDVAVGMGQAALAADPSTADDDPRLLRRRDAVFARVAGWACSATSCFPHRTASTSNPAKFADTAVPHMLSMLRSQGVGPAELTAKIAGGACMFGNGQFVQDRREQRPGDRPSVGSRRHQRRRARRRRHQRPPNRFDLATGCVTVASVGHPSQTI